MSPDSKALLVLVLGILFCLFIIFTSYSADHFALPIGYQSEIENTLQFETDIEFIVRDIRYNFGLSGEFSTTPEALAPPVMHIL